jgi:RNA 3'-terminal phosphate cyclase
MGTNDTYQNQKLIPMLICEENYVTTFKYTTTLLHLQRIVSILNMFTLTKFNNARNTLERCKTVKR